MNRRTWVAGAIAIAVAVWCYINFEWVSERQYVGYSGEAARNPLLALERLAQRMGAQASVARSASDLDDVPAGATLVLARKRHGMTAPRVQRLVRWIESGGHLVVEAERPDDRDALLDALSVVRTDGAAPATTAQVKLPADERAFAVDLAAMRLIDLKSRPGYTAAHGAGTAVLHFSHASGSVTVLPSMAFLTNAHIGENDHAAFAWGLIELGPGAHPARVSRVLLAPRFAPPSVLRWLAETGWPALAAGGVLLALWLWRAGRRFGPIQPQAHAERRRLLDHLQASGRYQWAAHAAPRLLAAAREASLAKIAKARPGLVDVGAAERTARVAELTGLPASEVELALHGDAHTARSFTAAVQTLQAIEEKLARRASL